MSCTACTEPQCLYSRAIPLLPLWAVRPVQSLSACTRVHFTFFTFVITHVKMCGLQNESRVVIVRAKKACVEVEVYLHSFLNFVLDGGEWSASSPSRFIPGKNLPLHIE